MKRWYPVMVNTAWELKIGHDLHLAGVERFVPSFTRWVIRRHTKAVRRAQVRPLMPGYLFASVDMDLPETHTLLAEKGVRGFILNAGFPVPVPAKAVEDLRALCAAGHFDDGAVRGGDNRFRKGDKVAILEGPFAGVEMEFQGRAVRRGHIALLARILGGSVEIEAPMEVVRAA